ncbi:alpha-N-arabinofuranosidase [Microbacterium sp. NPDC056044]|uniref:alpha-N-arabinofuranosidase n=1 Tax=Microbacterium sp. NPDC056044 TaxID=3345690 RepID=UPI0035DA3646
MTRTQTAVRRSSAATRAPHRVPITVGATIGTADRRLFGSFVEHLGRGVYGGVFDPGHPEADAQGFRSDVIALVRELGVTIVRYPGGNFVSGYDWRDGIGPVSERPRRLDLAWKSIETNEFGTDEFIAWCRASGTDPMLALNLGLGDVRSALQLLEYANHPGGTTLSDERIANGAPRPHDVRVWCLGNELDGPWQLGHKSAEHYADVAASAANAMRMFDPSLQLVVVGSSNADMPTFGTWEETVLERTIELVDFLSCHIYFFEDDDLAAFLRSADKLDDFLDGIQDVIRRVAARHPGARDVRISLDEWNVWNFRAYDDIKAARDFEQAPRLLEQEYTVADAVVVGSLLQSILAHCDTVSIAALAQLVNVIGPIRSEPDGTAWRQTTFFPFAAAARSAGHTVFATHTPDDAVVATVTRDASGSVAQVHVTNRSTDAPAVVEIDLAGLAPREVVRAEILWDPDPYAANTTDARNRVAPRTPATVLDGDRLRLTMPPISWAGIELSCSADG